MEEKIYMGRWELGCMVFNTLVFKLFFECSSVYAEYGGSAAWLNALYTGTVFLGLIFLVTKVYAPYRHIGICGLVGKKFGKTAENITLATAMIYFTVSGIYVLYNVCSTLKYASFPKSPIWYIAIFVLAAVLTTVLNGERAVRRTHSLFTLGVGVSVLLISLLSLKYGNIDNLMPIMGKGTKSVFIRGLKSLLLYADVLFVLFFPCNTDKKVYVNTIAVSSVAGVLVNVIVLFAFSFNFPHEVSEISKYVLYSLTKGAGAGKFTVRTDICFLLSLMTTSMLYISLAAHMVVRAAAKIKLNFKVVVTSCLILISGFFLCGCYDSREVEKGAYVTAIGIDNGTDGNLIYTFQISNPLGSGVSREETEDVDEKNAGGINNTADTVPVSAENFSGATDLLKSKIGKEPEFSHIKLVVLSKDIAVNGTLSYIEELLKDGEVRPSANLCLTDSAKMYLTEIKPTLEKSTVRYYELFFSDRSNPYIVHSELLDFYSDAAEGSKDSVLPYVDGNGFCGMGIFDNWHLCDVLTREETGIYNMLCGKSNSEWSIDEFVVKCVEKPWIYADISTGYPQLYINIKLKISPEQNSELIRDNLQRLAENFLEKTRNSGCDVIGFGRIVKCKFSTEFDWKEYNWKSNYKNARFYINIITENGK